MSSNIPAAPFTYDDHDHDHDRYDSQPQYSGYVHATTSHNTQSSSYAKMSGSPHHTSASTSIAAQYISLPWPRPSRNTAPLTRERKLALLRSYLPDWIITILLAGLLAIINKVDGFHREFSLTDTSIQHTFATSERVPMWLLGLVAVIVPAIILLVVSLVAYKSIWDAHNALLGFVLAHALTVTATTIIKVCVGRPRPDLIDRCQPRPGAANAPVYGLATDAICTADYGDGFRSFPSGHASAAFAGLTFLALFLAAKTHLRRSPHALAVWIVITPLMAATLVAISRTMDYRHHATDVIAGSLLGLLIAYASYRLYYPPLSHPRCHLPYAPRVPLQDHQLDHHSVPREEEEDLDTQDNDNELQRTSLPKQPHHHNGLHA